jgi:hypothetical protein
MDRFHVLLSKMWQGLYRSETVIWERKDRQHDEILLVDEETINSFVMAK